MTLARLSQRDLARTAQISDDALHMGRTSFSPAELDAIKSLLHETRRADRSRQKVLRARLRRSFDFYITDFATDQQGFVASDVDALVRRGVITVIEECASPAPTGRSRVSPPEGVSPARSTAASAPSGAPAIPRTFDRADLEAAGFSGWRTWIQLRESELAEVPRDPGAYVVYRAASGNPVFVDISPGGRFKGREPTVAIETLADNWVAAGRVVYIGKADTLRVRLQQYARFGAGEPVGHWGGRYIWQLADSDELLVAWHAISWNEIARDYERRLLDRFAALHGARRPLANPTG